MKAAKEVIKLLKPFAGRSGTVLQCVVDSGKSGATVANISARLDVDRTNLYPTLIALMKRGVIVRQSEKMPNSRRPGFRYFAAPDRIKEIAELCKTFANEVISN